MDEYGDMTIVCHPFTKVYGTYAISPKDGRVTVNGWNEFMDNEYLLEIGDNMLFLLHVGHQVLFCLFSILEGPRALCRAVLCYWRFFVLCA
jgi:hypothetical protein